MSLENKLDRMIIGLDCKFKEIQTSLYGLLVTYMVTFVIQFLVIIALSLIAVKGGA